MASNRSSCGRSRVLIRSLSSTQAEVQNPRVQFSSPVQAVLGCVISDLAVLSRIIVPHSPLLGRNHIRGLQQEFSRSFLFCEAPNEKSMAAGCSGCSRDRCCRHRASRIRHSQEFVRIWDLLIRSQSEWFRKFRCNFASGEFRID